MGRRGVFENALVRQAEDGELAASARVRDGSQAGAAVDGSDGRGGNGAAANDDEAGAGASSFSLLAAERRDHACGSRVEHGYHVYSHAPRLSVPGGDPGLAQPVRVVVAVVESAG